MRIIVSDSSCLIDLRKASLLGPFLRLPYEIVIPDTLFHDELLKFTEAERTLLITGGLQIRELPGKGVERAQDLERGFPSLSIHDCFAFALAEHLADSILLSGDGKLRSVAKQHSIEVHGILWVIEEMYKEATATVEPLVTALELFDENPAIYRLPRRELRALLKHLLSETAERHV